MSADQAMEDFLEMVREVLRRDVPSHIRRYQSGPVSNIVRRSRDLPSEIRRLADLIEKGATVEQTELALKTFAEGVALAAFRPGGVAVLGLHFEAHHTNTTLN